MEKIYSEEQNACRQAKTSEETIKFLLNFSKSLRITGYREFRFETNLN